MKVADFWVIERGDAIHTLRACYQVPPKLGFTVGDIKINNKLIQFGGPIIDKLQVRLRAMSFAADEPVLPLSLCSGIRAAEFNSYYNLRLTWNNPTGSLCPEK